MSFMNTVLSPRLKRVWARFGMVCLVALAAACGSSVEAVRGTGAGGPGSTRAILSLSQPPSALTAHFVLLGEVHDNPAHHQARAELLQGLLTQEPHTVVVVEQISRDHDAAMAKAREQGVDALDAVLAAGQFDRKGWRWPLHQPIFEVVVHSPAELRGGNLERDQVRRIVREGDAAWPQDLLALRARTAWSEAQQQTLAQDIQEGHCGAMPPSMLPGMVNAQRARDAAMAQAMLNARAQGAKRVVLIAGNGHVRRDVAVPVYLQAAGVAPSEMAVVAYLETDSATPAALYDQIERAPAPPREDPCAAFKR
jgi:uncharacterized iron-regulated protein